MSINDPWSYSEMSPPSRATSPIFLQSDNVNAAATATATPNTTAAANNNLPGSKSAMDSELASIVSSLSALSNPVIGNANAAFVNNLNNNNNQIGSFRGTGSDIGDNTGSINNYLDVLKSNTPHSRKSPLSVGTAPPGFSAATFFNSINTKNSVNVSNNNGSVQNAHSVNNNHHAGSLDQRMDILKHYSASVNGPILFNDSINNTMGNNVTAASVGVGGTQTISDVNNIASDDASNNESAGFFETFGKSLVDGTREIENGSKGNLMASLSAGNSLTNVQDLLMRHSTNNSSSIDQQRVNNIDASRSTNVNTNLSVKGRKPSITSSMATDLTAITSATESSTSSYHEMSSSNNASLSTNRNSNIPNPYGDANNQYDMQNVRRNIWNMQNFSTLPVFKPNAIQGVNNYNNHVNDAPPIDPQNSLINPNMFMFPSAMGMPPTATQPVNPMSMQIDNPYFYVDQSNSGNNGNQMKSNNNMENAKNILEENSSKSKMKNNNAINNNNSRNRNNNNNNGTHKPNKQANPYLDNNIPAHVLNSSATNQIKFPKKSGNNNNNNSGNAYNNATQGRNNTKMANSTQQANKIISSQQYHRSALLEEFRNNTTNKQYTLKDIHGHTLEFCKDQHGSRFIQHELAVVKPSEKEIIFNKIRDHILELSDDVFGNYVIQKFFEFGSETQRKVLVENFRGKMIKLSMQMYACRVIQRALEFIEPDQKIELVLELKDCVLPMIKDQNGNHVIQKAIEHIPISEISFILQSLTGQIYHLSTHAYGCRVIQRLLEFGSKENQTAILEELFDFIPYLIQDQYGNYVIQYLLQQKEEDLEQENFSPRIKKAKQEIINIVSENVVDFSKHKFASNVVEKTILYGNKEQRKTILSQILPHDLKHASSLNDDDPMILMMRDQFANYVVQKLVGVTEGEEKKLIVVAIRSYLEKLNSSNSLGNRHLASVEKLAALVENVRID
ncbi:hypothetical protein TPHA_0N00650 [Tetrapisispora phaffii CBS 4417]|uniref:Pumilio homology domain family member 3 n=1 Tax=Tetrapisispora phaffii (strain ATCC 24235 / CBS 4417 / NBRC 1672 / NRRL Y-8282 / UCD 70-5) TaxID=1071381 RepID=G8C118_TETPH|nr:hypothetical protein TPHA_0N00650 [Tetrapisispora phaffii CBS 4417]CCE65846.1 hypothetical protein TPHA_0N00650 [Tetrapisispora phaffii CBS 4417]